MTSKGFWNSGWVETIASLLAVAGLVASLLPGFNPRGWQDAASDFKTVYASAWCFARGLNAYSLESLHQAYVTNRIILPGSWYGHAPVYPSFTLGLLAPLTHLPMATAIWLCFVLFSAAIACAIAAVARDAAHFGLGPGWRLALVGVAIGCPLLNTGLLLVNLSVLCIALCILAVTGDLDQRPWLRACALGFAPLLKPHLAVWVLIALFLLPTPATRRLALRAASLCLCAILALSVVAWASHPAGLQLHAYQQIFHSETVGGSMDPRNREVAGVGTQITALRSLAGFWLRSLPLIQLVNLILAALAVALAWATRQHAAASPRLRPVFVAAWCSLGLLATYHRDHDGYILFLMLPWLFSRIRLHWRRPWQDPLPVAVLLACLAMSIQAQDSNLEALAVSRSALPAVRYAASLLLYRQGCMATLLMTLLLLEVVFSLVQQPSDIARSSPSRTLKPQLL